MVLLILLVLALFVLQTLLPGRFREPAAPGEPGSLAQRLGNRDHMRPFTLLGQRAARALANMQEAMPVFLAVALLDMIVAPQAALAVTGATIFLVARALYVAVYLAGIAVVRSLLWAASWVGLILMLMPLFDRI